MNATILLVLPPHRSPELLKLLGGKDLRIFFATNLQEANQQLSGPTSYDLLIVDSELPDGPWHDLLEFVLNSTQRCEMIVCSRVADELLWAEVLQRGAYDLLVEPYNRQEVHRIVEGALDSRYMRKFMKTAADGSMNEGLVSRMPLPYHSATKSDGKEGKRHASTF